MLELKSDVVEGEQFSTIVAYYNRTIKKEKPTRVYEKFLLRADENGNWKIVGWEKTESVDIEE